MRNTASPRNTTDSSISMAELLCLGFESTSGAAGSRKGRPVRYFVVANLENLQVDADEDISDKDQTTDLSDSTFGLKTKKNKQAVTAQIKTVSQS